MWYNEITRSETVLTRSPTEGVRTLARKSNNSRSNTNECPLKRATASKIRNEGQAAILREIKWSIFAFVLISGLIALTFFGVDLKDVAEVISSADGLVDIGVAIP
ncbi:hypothetical protein JI667_18845 [Bacillus sp. NTK074B]|uniref:hypothetical protein n=1 Tax=Bacillus sp. NTK074B TaxID=2802174 RepID=UPI001A8CD8BB|nr:hypothetical protein [Bacillus sp. NTK074B]